MFIFKSQGLITFLNFQLRVVNDEVRFELVPDLSKNITHLTTVKFDSRGSWHVVALSYYKGDLKLNVDFKQKESQLYSMRFQLGDKIVIGSGGKSNIGSCQTFKLSIKFYKLEKVLISLKVFFPLKNDFL